MFVRRDATILHADLDAFFAAVEQRDNPELRGRPVLVGAGVVLCPSYEAKACGVHSALAGATSAVSSWLNRRFLRCSAGQLVSPRASRRPRLRCYGVLGISSCPGPRQFWRCPVPCCLDWSLAPFQPRARRV